MNPVRDDTATTACPICAVRFEPEGRQRFWKLHQLPPDSVETDPRRRRGLAGAGASPTDQTSPCRTAMATAWQRFRASRRVI
ncbi:MAG: hypothetical protein ACRDWW_07920, partial [Acidimicrobiales bacterium]